MIELRPISQADAFAFIRQHHRHHSVPVGALWWHGAHDDDGVLIGVAIVGRPVARRLDDGLTVEVTRLCTNGAHNACSMLYGAARRVAMDKGYRRVITYTLPEEGGASLRAAGWDYLGRTPGKSWSVKSRPREDKHPLGEKDRWGCGSWPDRAALAASKPAPACHQPTLPSEDAPQAIMDDHNGIGGETPMSILRRIRATTTRLLNEGDAEIAALRANLRHVISERDRTFALMLARAEKAEADLATARAETAMAYDRKNVEAQISEGVGAILRKFCESDHAAKARHHLHAMPDSDWNTLVSMLADAVVSTTAHATEALAADRKAVRAETVAALINVLHCCDTEAQAIASRIAGPRGMPNQCQDVVQVLEDAETIIRAAAVLIEKDAAP